MENSGGKMVDLHIQKVLREGLSTTLTYHRSHGLSQIGIMGKNTSDKGKLSAKALTKTGIW